MGGAPFLGGWGLMAAETDLRALLGWTRRALDVTGVAVKRWMKRRPEEMRVGPGVRWMAGGAVRPGDRDTPVVLLERLASPRMARGAEGRPCLAEKSPLLTPVRKMAGGTVTGEG